MYFLINSVISLIMNIGLKSQSSIISVSSTRYTKNECPTTTTTKTEKSVNIDRYAQKYSHERRRWWFVFFFNFKTEKNLVMAWYLIYQLIISFNDNLKDFKIWISLNFFFSYSLCVAAVIISVENAIFPHYHYVAGCCGWCF